MARLKPMLNLLFICLIFSSCDCDKALEKVQIQIESPKQNGEVAMRDMVRGKISDPKVPVYVLVHPLKGNQWWVQPLPSPANQDGSWRTSCFFGAEIQGIGEEFEVLALATTEKLKEGQIFKELPKCGARSDIVTVKRTR